MIKKHLYIETYGCQMNVNDSDRIFTMMEAIGYLPTDNPAKADETDCKQG